MNKVTTKTEYVAIALESKEVHPWYGDYIIKKGTERVLTKKQAEKAKESGITSFPVDDSTFAGYYKVPCKVIKRTITTTINTVDEDY